jgi:DNA-binding XRE family transcriptional regulator
MAKQLDMAEIWPTPALFRAARGLLGIGQEDLAEKTGFARKTIILIESHVGVTMDARREVVVRELAAFLEKEGIEFVRPRGREGAGVRFVDREREGKVVEKLRADIERRKADRERKAAERGGKSRVRKKKPGKR